MRILLQVGSVKFSTLTNVAHAGVLAKLFLEWVFWLCVFVVIAETTVWLHVVDFLNSGS